MDYSSLGGGGGSAGDKAQSAASSATSGQQFGSNYNGSTGDGALSPIALVAAAGIFILGLVGLVWTISRGK